MMENIYIVEGARTAFGSFGKSLRTKTATELGTITAKEALKRSGYAPKEIDNVVYGNVIHSHTNAAYLARHIALTAEVPIETPALTVNRLCGSGMQAIVSAAQSIALGESEVALAGGAENMSLSPHVSFTSRFGGVKYGSLQFADMLTSTLTDELAGCGMGITAENLAAQYEITREEQDDFALLSQERAKKAVESQRFAKEIIGVEVEGSVIDQDEHIKQTITKEKLATFSPAFKKEGTVTSGNASGINDGAASVIVVHENRLLATNKPLAKITSWAVAGVDPKKMGIGPVPAIQQALKRANLTVGDIDLFEVNEAFAAQYIAVEKELQLNREKTNVNGGAIALGHPVGASGTRIVLSLAYELKARGLKYGVASLCIGGGQGIALVIENMNS